MGGLNGHYDMHSANTLRNSVKNSVAMFSSTKRFKVEVKGGHFSNTYADNSGFNNNALKKKEEGLRATRTESEPREIKGRPLFAREEAKVSPAPNHYDVRRNTEIVPLNTDKEKCTFGHSF